MKINYSHVVIVLLIVAVAKLGERNSVYRYMLRGRDLEERSPFTSLYAEAEMKINDSASDKEWQEFVGRVSGSRLANGAKVYINPSRSAFKCADSLSVLMIYEKYYIEKMAKEYYLILAHGMGYYVKIPEYMYDDIKSKWLAIAHE